MKKKMKAFKANYIPKLELSGVNYAVLMLIVGIVCLFCVYILSCICSLYDKLKDEGKSLPLIGSTEYGAVRESESDDWDGKEWKMGTVENYLSINLSEGVKCWFY